jgi:hypothetical protein
MSRFVSSLQPIQPPDERSHPDTSNPLFLRWFLVPKSAPAADPRCDECGTTTLARMWRRDCDLRRRTRRSGESPTYISRRIYRLIYVRDWWRGRARKQADTNRHSVPQASIQLCRLLSNQNLKRKPRAPTPRVPLSGESAESHCRSTLVADGAALGNPKHRLRRRRVNA